MTFTLPFPPTGNLYWRKSRAGHTYTSPEAKAYRQRAAMLALEQGVRMLKGPVKVEILIYRPADRGDCDNYLKVSLDSLNGIAWTDDKQVKRIEAEKFVDRANPRLEVTVTAAEGAKP